MSDDRIQQAVERLRQGGLVAFPTDTLYALGADPFNPHAVQRVFRAKRRPPDMGLPLLLSNSDMLQQAAADVSQLATTPGSQVLAWLPDHAVAPGGGCVALGDRRAGHRGCASSKSLDSPTPDHGAGGTPLPAPVPT